MAPRFATVHVHSVHLGMIQETYFCVVYDYAEIKKIFNSKVY